MTTPDASLLRAAAAAAAGAQQYPAGALYMVATPIGNRADIGLRALHLLGLVEAVACEDTRHTAGLLRPLGLSPALIALHQHNEQSAAEAVLVRLAAGERVACVSDAGTPGVSDPGARLVARVREAGHPVLAVPGASAVAAAVSVAGLDAGPWTFHGFLPASATQRDAVLLAALAQPGALVLFEAPHRIGPLAQVLARLATGRRVTVCRELTKQFESVATHPAEALPGWLAADSNRARGEFVVVVHAAEAGPQADEGLSAPQQRVLGLLLDEGLPVRQAVSLTAGITGAPRNRVYAAALALREAPPPQEDGEESGP